MLPPKAAKFHRLYAAEGRFRARGPGPMGPWSLGTGLGNTDETDRGGLVPAQGIQMRQTEAAWYWLREHN